MSGSIFVFYKSILLVCYLHKFLILWTLIFQVLMFMNFSIASAFIGRVEMPLKDSLPLLLLGSILRKGPGRKKREINRRVLLEFHLTLVICQYIDN